MEAILIRCISALIGTVGFALMFSIGTKRLVWASLGGLLTWVMYELAILFGGGPLIAAFASSLFMSLYSEAMARIVRAPTVVFLFPSAIPIVPGGSLYYTIYNLLYYDESAFLSNAKSTLSVALGIAVGMSVSSIIIGVIRQANQMLADKKTAQG